MNYLAHFYLAYPDEDLMFGNYIGDGIKGKDLSQYSDNVKRGIQFHRFIDTFTDQHSLVQEAKKRFYKSQRKFSGVVVDVLFDHILAKQWTDHADEQLFQFAQQCYSTIEKHPEPMPLRSERFFHYMVSNNILEGYASVSGIERVLMGMDSRTAFDSNMVNSISDYMRHKPELHAIFTEFFPQLINATKQWLKEN